MAASPPLRRLAPRRAAATSAPHATDLRRAAHVIRKGPCRCSSSQRVSQRRVVLCTQTANDRSMRLAAELGFTDVESYEKWVPEQWFATRPWSGPGLTVRKGLLKLVREGLDCCWVNPSQCLQRNRPPPERECISDQSSIPLGINHCSQVGQRFRLHVRVANGSDDLFGSVVVAGGGDRGGQTGQHPLLGASTGDRNGDFFHSGMQGLRSLDVARDAVLGQHLQTHPRVVNVVEPAETCRAADPSLDLAWGASPSDCGRWRRGLRRRCPGSPALVAPDAVAGSRP
ncbi:hypothetical protein SAMN05421684_2152 [Asanoa ishikariensis]|uniref:Uncharacterized protein n=1 Tax=Asanoa ishikariensis TaxID=137265 RepID=A0A1H3NLM2_9ACTN|nr:hypothetical protein SAMN05421684_2152 [Asanoa ishikariensis]